MSFVFTENNKSHTASKQLEHTEMACLSSWISGKETSAKKTLFSQEERLIRTVIDDSLSYRFLVLVFEINSFSIMKTWEARNERKIGLFIKTMQDLTIRRKVTRKKQVKFAILLGGLFICLFQFSYWNL